MDIAVRKRFILAPLAALLIGLSAILIFADASSAATPAGIGCQSSEGKISGRGSTYQNVLQKEYIRVYGEDFCGSVELQYTGDPSEHAMIVYNYPKAVEASLTGSGNGEKGASCRTDAFTGTDVPYTEAQLLQLNGAPGEEAGGAANCPNKTANPLFAPPFEPKAEPWPNVNDIAAPVMAFPIGGSSVTVAVHLTAGSGGSCPTLTAAELPKSLEFTQKEVSRLYGGDVAAWNDAEIVATNATLAPKLKECSGEVVRVVRQDSSGTTSILKQFLIRAQNAREGATCKGKGNPATPEPWANFFATNTEWPGKQHPTEEGTCSKIVTGEKSGGPELVKKLGETPGGVGYVDLAEANVAGIVLASVEPATLSGFQSPSVGGGAANCLYSSLNAPPGSSPSEAVGLNTEDNWSNNNETNGGGTAPNHENATDLGNKYPICGLTFDLVYSGLNSNNAEGKGAISRLTADQRRTMYSYFTFILSSAGQEIPPKIHYAALPASWLPKLEQGFHENF
jgi:ABC-type phosphate transport system substrate-binding protein